ncbi:MAG TPA: hypothetical protein DHV52_01855 [Parachlamydiales bacterium]|nr:hypothetical protein [Parachlamydiales bacterium]
MQVCEKALYNLLRFNWLKDRSVSVLPWQVEDYREQREEELFGRLKALGLLLDEERFLAAAKEAKDPEELADRLWGKKEERAQAYLLLFELWRRLLSERQTLSLFCDELDQHISLYERGIKDGSLEELLSSLEDLLDSYVDKGEDPKKCFRMVSCHLAYNLERFLYEYIRDLIASKDETGASEWIDGFYDYISNPKWFDFLRIHLFAEVERHDTAVHLQRLVESLKARQDFDLLLEIARFLISFGQDPLFRQILSSLLEAAETDEEFNEILSRMLDYFCRLDQDEKGRVIEEMIRRRSCKEPQGKLDAEDPDLERLRNLLQG